MLAEDWEFNTLGVYNYKKDGPLSSYFDFVANNHDNLAGHVLEAGVFQGRSLLGMALMLKELRSNKKVYGFDTFTGFPPVYHEFDKLENFALLLEAGRISEAHYQKVQKNQKVRSLFLQEPVNERNISLSGAFENNSMELLSKKIEFLELDNVVLVPGPFDVTMKDSAEYGDGWCAALFDCDLYDSYIMGLKFVWDKMCAGGYIYLDEYYSLKFAGARIAVDEFLANKSDKPMMHEIKPGDFERWAVVKGRESEN